MKFQEVKLPSVEFLDGGKVLFKKPATFQDVAFFLEVEGANLSGECNSSYAIGTRFVFSVLPSEEALCGRIHTKFNGEKYFSIEGVLLQDRRTFLKRFSGHNSNPEFDKFLRSHGIEEINDHRFSNIELGC